MREQIGAIGGRQLVVNGVKLAYTDQGQGPVLLCLHAIGHGARDYAPLQERMQQRYRVIALDWPGHGASDAEDHVASDERFAAHLEGFVSALGLERLILLGNSVGGAAAIRFTARHAEQVRALIVANPGGLFSRYPGVTLSIRLLSRVFDAGARGASWYPRVFGAYYRRVLLCEPAAEQRARIIDAAYELSPILAASWRGFAEPAADIRDLAAQVQCPVLVAWATLDPVNKLWLNRGGIRRFPNMRLEKFRAGHTPFLEMPDQFAATLDDFLNHALASETSPRTRAHASA